jgi:uncharacterized protein YutE (UPF0331/DUF86 family)
MTAKEKSRELVNTFFQYTQRRAEAKLCAIVCAEEMIDEISNLITDEKEHLNGFYSDVLNELHKL